jgi:hypothetical protein
MEPPPPYAHTAPEDQLWEPLFTPFGKIRTNANAVVATTRAAPLFMPNPTRFDLNRGPLPIPSLVPAPRSSQATTGTVSQRSRAGLLPDPARRLVPSSGLPTVSIRTPRLRDDAHPVKPRARTMASEKPNREIPPESAYRGFSAANPAPGPATHRKHHSKSGRWTPRPPKLQAGPPRPQSQPANPPPLPAIRPPLLTPFPESALASTTHCQARNATSLSKSLPGLRPRALSAAAFKQTSPIRKSARTVACTTVMPKGFDDSLTHSSGI